MAWWMGANVLLWCTKYYTALGIFGHELWVIGSRKLRDENCLRLDRNLLCIVDSAGQRSMLQEILIA